MADNIKKVSVTKQMYGWTKWGGPNMGLVKEELDEWYCQVCSSRQTRALPAYMIPLDKSERDFVRVCSLCKNKQLVAEVEDFYSLINKVRKPQGLDALFASIENLLTQSTII